MNDREGQFESSTTGIGLTQASRILMEHSCCGNLNVLEPYPGEIRRSMLGAISVNHLGYITDKTLAVQLEKPGHLEGPKITQAALRAVNGASDFCFRLHAR